MIKNIQIKIVILFILVGVILVGSLGGLYIHNLQELNNEVLSNNAGNIQEISNLIINQISSTKVMVIIFIILFIILSFIIGIFAVKNMMTPITDFVKNAGDLSKTDELKTKYLSEGKGNKNVNEFVSAFNTVTTELNENLNEIKKQKKQIETILLHMTDGIIAFDLEGKITHINPAATKFLELQEADDNFEKIFKKLNIDINIEKLIYLEEWTSSEQNIHIGDRYVNIFFAPFKDSNEKTAGVMVLVQDVTEHVKLDNMRKEFVADVSHELKTPITSIMGYADTLLEGEYDKDTQNRFLNVIASEARRMAKLVTDLLTLSRYDNNNVKIEKLEFDLGDLVKRCEEKLELEISKKLNEISKLKKSLERDNTKLNEQEHEIINNAKIQARNILLDAKEEANEIISKMNDVSKSNSDLNNLRNKLNKDIKDISATSLSNNVAKESKSAISVEDAKPNTEVFVTTLGQNGIIVSNVSKSNEVQVQVGSMKLSVNLKYLEKIVNTNKNNKSTSSYSSVSKAKNVSSEINVIGLNVEEAVFVVDKFLDDCSIANLQTVRIVHGKGTGKLREGIHKFLKSNSRVKSFRVGTYGEGEMGVTVVELK